MKYFKLAGEIGFQTFSFIFNQISYNIPERPKTVIKLDLHRLTVTPMRQ